MSGVLTVIVHQFNNCSRIIKIQVFNRSAIMLCFHFDFFRRIHGISYMSSTSVYVHMNLEVYVKFPIIPVYGQL